MADISTLQGYWRSVGYDWVLEITKNSYTLYDAVKNILVFQETGSFTDFKKAYDQLSCHGTEEFSLHQKHDITRYHFKREALEKGSYQFIKPNENDNPILNFDMLAETFKQHYIFFELRQLDWQSICAHARTQVTENTTQLELLAIFREMLLPLQDGHVSLTGDAGSITTTLKPNLRESLQKAFQLPAPYISPKNTVDALSGQLHAKILAPFKENMGPLKSTCNGILNWCDLGGGIAYLNVLRLFGFADTQDAIHANDLPHKRQDVGPFLENDLIALNEALDIIFNDFETARAIILDIRVNGGGFDRAAMEIANRFADAKRLAFRKKAKAGHTITPYQNFYVEPAGPAQFTGPTFILTSPFCLSAGEIFTLCMNSLPHVTSVGENTLGMLSDNLNKRLPNGWEFSLSNEVYETPSGEVYEGCGVPADIPFVTMDTNSIITSMQDALIYTKEMASK